MFIFQIKVSLVDGSLLDTITGHLKLTVTETIVRQSPAEPFEPLIDRPWRRWRPWPPRPPRPVETTREQDPQFLSIETDGLVHFKFRTSNEVKKMSLKVKPDINNKKHLSK